MPIKEIVHVLTLVIAFAAYPQGKHWAETSDETVWRGTYENCDHGYFVNLAPGVVGHGSRSPSPNHGILVSAIDPGRTAEVTLDDPRLVDVYDSTDAMELGSPQAYVERYDLKSENASERITILELRNTQFRGSAAVYVHFRKAAENATSEVEELVAYRTSKEFGPSFYVIMLRTTPELFSHDHILYHQVLGGLRFVPPARCPAE